MKDKIKVKAGGWRGWKNVPLSRFDPAVHEIYEEPFVPSADADMATLRERYQDAYGKRPFMGWDAGTLRAKIAEAD